MMFMEAGIQMDTVFGDVSASQSGGLFGKLCGAGKRLVTGESLFTTVYTNTGSGKRRVAFAAPYPGKILEGRALVDQVFSFALSVGPESISRATRLRLTFRGRGCSSSAVVPRACYRGK